MTSLEEEVARVARLRGADPERYRDTEANRDRVAWDKADRATTRHDFRRLLFCGSPDPQDVKRELEAVDVLPPILRTWVKGAPLYVNALQVLFLLEHCDHRVRPVAEALDRTMVQMVKLDARHHYGPSHLQA